MVNVSVEASVLFMVFANIIGHLIIVYFRKLQHVLTNRLLKFFADQAKKEPEKYYAFYEDYGMFLREGIVTSPEQETRVIRVNGYSLREATLLGFIFVSLL